MPFDSPAAHVRHARGPGNIVIVMLRYPDRPFAAAGWPVRPPLLRLAAAVFAFALIWQLALLPASRGWDAAVAAWVQSARPLLDRPAAFVMEAGNAGTVLLAALLLAAGCALVNRRAAARTLWLAAVLGAGSALAVALKHLIPHPGPSAEYFRPALAGAAAWRLDTPYGFPSGHTLRATLIAGTALRRLPWLAAGLVLAMMAALVYGDGHWPSEVLGGLCLGWALLEAGGLAGTL
jgi:membrane-associated phospholipid phosphatase